MWAEHVIRYRSKGDLDEIGVEYAPTVHVRSVAPKEWALELTTRDAHRISVRFASRSSITLEAIFNEASESLVTRLRRDHPGPWEWGRPWGSCRIRRGSRGAIEGFLVEWPVESHLERLDEASWFLGLALGDGSHVQLYLLSYTTLTTSLDVKGPSSASQLPA